MHVAEALDLGTRARTGGARCPTGRRLLPADRAHRLHPAGAGAARVDGRAGSAPVRVMPDLDTALAEAVDDEYGLAATVLTRDMAHAQTA